TVTMHTREPILSGTTALTLVPDVAPSSNQRVYQTQVSDTQGAFVLEFAAGTSSPPTNAANAAAPMSPESSRFTAPTNPIPAAVLEQVFGDESPTAHQVAAYTPNAIFPSESNELVAAEIRDLAQRHADALNEWMPDNGLLFSRDGLLIP